LVTHGRLPMLDRLRGEADPVALLASVPGIGRVLANRLHEELGLETLADVEAMIAVKMGGRIAEEIILNQLTTGAHDDLQIAKAAAVAELQEVHALAISSRLDPTVRRDTPPRFRAQEIADVVAGLQHPVIPSKTARRRKAAAEPERRRRTSSTRALLLPEERAVLGLLGDGPAVTDGTARPSTARPARSDRLQVVVDVALGLILLQAVMLLQTADEHVLLAGDVLEVVVGELGPLRTQLAFGFFPFPLDLIPVHRFVSLVRELTQELTRGPLPRDAALVP